MRTDKLLHDGACAACNLTVSQPLDNIWILCFAFAIGLHDLDPRHFDAPTAALSASVAAK